MGRDAHGLLGIVASWVLSPVLSGALAVPLLLATDRLCVRAQDPVRRSLRALAHQWQPHGLPAFKKVELERLTSKGEATENEATENKK